MIGSYEFSPGKFLCVQSVGASAPVVEEKPTDHLVVLDVSYSMAGELTLVREHLKQRLISLVKKGDTLSVFWFSGRDQHGKLFSSMELGSLLDIKAVHDAIDRYIKPIGMTGFKEPLSDVLAHVKDRKKSSKSLANLIFMSDGCDNQWPREEILSVVDELSKVVDSAIFVEYGYYADRKLLSTMAERLGGGVVCSEDFPSFQPVLEKGITSSVATGAAVMVDVPGGKEFAFGFLNGDLRFYEVVNGAARVPCDPKTKTMLHDLYWVADRVAGESIAMSPDALLGAIAALGFRMRGSLVKPLLLQLREPDLLEAFSRCFGKQRYSEFQSLALSKIGKPVVQVSEEKVREYYRTDLPTIVDLFEALADFKATAMIEDAAFKYSRITKKMEVDDPNPLVFRANGRDGYPISDLVLNSTRPNISMRLKKTGALSLAVEGKPSKLPKEVQAYQWRNYALVADGVVHIDLLPIQMPAEEFQKFRETWVFRALDEVRAFPGISDNGDTFGLMLNLEKVGLTNAQEVEAPVGQTLAELEVELLYARAEQKVWKDYREEHAPPERIDPALASVFGETEAKWLAEKGYSKGCFEPKKKAAQTSDVYMAVVLETKIKSYNTLPKISEVLERLASGGKKKLTPSMELLRPWVQEAEALVKTCKKSELGKELEGREKLAISRARNLLFEIAKRKYAIVLGQTWFSDAEAPGVFKTRVTRKGVDYEVEINLVDKEVEV